MALHIVTIEGERIATYNPDVAQRLAQRAEKPVETIEDHYAYGDYDDLVVSLEETNERN